MFPSRRVHTDTDCSGHQAGTIARRTDQPLARATPSFFNASSGQPFHSATIVLHRYCRSVTPILLDQNPEAARSRKLLKKATPAENAGFAFAGHAMASNTAVRSPAAQSA